MYFGNAQVLGSGGGLSIKHERIAEIIRDLNPDLSLAYIPEEQRSSFDKHPFAILHNQHNGQPPYVAMTMTENEVDERLIAKLIKRDTHHNAVLDEIDAHETSLRLIKAKSDLDEMEEKREFTHSVLSSNKSVYKHGGAVYR